jgi:DNA-binding MarR family transcriptional regulator
MEKSKHVSQSGATQNPVPEQQLFLNLVRAKEHVMSQLTNLLKEHGLSEPQFNVLRILQGAGPDGLSCQKVSERMLTREPDITRLVDRLQTSGYVSRNRRTGKDRRLVVLRISHKGLKLLGKLDLPVIDLHQKQFFHFSRAELRELNRLLVKVIG